MTPLPWIVVTDLDGTLLDAETYGWRPARFTLESLAAREIPVVFCTSKTRAEAETLQKELGVSGPLIVESGGALCIDGKTIILGVPYKSLLGCFREMKAATGGVLRGFSDLTDQETADLTGLSLSRAQWARQREYDEPFFFDRDEDRLIDAVIQKAAKWGLRVTRSGRFWHLHGQADKGLAIRRLLEYYPGFRSIGLGDSAMDLPMLEVVDVPVIVARPDGTHDPHLHAALPLSYKTRESGPAGWAEAVEQFILQTHTDETIQLFAPPVRQSWHRHELSD